MTKRRKTFGQDSVSVQQIDKAPAGANKLTTAITEQGAGYYLSPEDRIAKLEVVVVQLDERLAKLERSFNLHSHVVPGVSVGFLSEPINGRRVLLAIDPTPCVHRSGLPIVDE